MFNRCKTMYLQRMFMTADFWISLTALLGGVFTMGLMYHIEKRPRRGLKPKLIPTTFLLLLGLLLMLGAGAHLLGYIGIHPPKG